MWAWEEGSRKKGERTTEEKQSDIWRLPVFSSEGVCGWVFCKPVATCAARDILPLEPTQRWVNVGDLKVAHIPAPLLLVRPLCVTMETMPLLSPQHSSVLGYSYMEHDGITFLSGSGINGSYAHDTSTFWWSVILIFCGFGLAVRHVYSQTQGKRVCTFQVKFLLYWYGQYGK